MRLYDTRTDQYHELVLPSDRPLTMYVCGVTPYDTTHVGHAHTYLIFDVLLRYLRAQGAQVRYCQNVTDVDDPLFARATRDGIAWQDLARQETQRFVDDCQGLNILPPDYMPRASEEIDGMIPLIVRLIELGHAYARAGNVYFRVKSDPDYGAMARMGYDDMLKTANERGNNPADPHKEDPLDFVLWQTSAPGLPTWPSPWGAGRPGWHIECSEMALRYLGPQIDIHGGGRDLIFPHHPSEIAQIEPVTGAQPFARFWMHGGLVWLDGEKMSKSLGNMVFVRDALREHGGDVLRWYLLSNHYRTDFFYDRAALTGVRAQVAQLRAALECSGGAATPLDPSEAQATFLAALADDLQTPQALAVIESLSATILAAAEVGRAVQSAQAALRDMAQTIGFRLSEAT